MKTNLNTIEKNRRIRRPFLPLFLFITMVIVSASSLIPDQEDRKKDNQSDRRLTLLEKLEKGVPVKSEEIRSSFDVDSDDEIDLVFDFPLIISHQSLEEMNETIRGEMEELHHELRDLRNSDEFKDAMEELRKGGEEIRREMEKLREEFNRSGSWSFEWDDC